MLTKTSTQAIRAVICLAQLPEGRYGGASAVAREINAPGNYLGKLLHRLAGRNILCSQKGLGGGFRLSRTPERISLLHVAEAIENVGQWNECVLGQAQCGEGNPCPAHAHWKPVRERYLEFLRKTSIAKLMKGGNFFEK